MTAETKIVEQKVADLNNYFVEKILNKRFDLVNIDQYTATISIDGCYQFDLWICNNENSLRCYEGHYNFMQLDFSTPQKKLLHKQFNETLRQKKVDILNTEKKRIEEQLKKLV